MPVFFLYDAKPCKLYPQGVIVEEAGCMRITAITTQQKDTAMIKQSMKLVITFHTTTDALSMESACKAAGADGRLIPVPGFISAGCGLAWCAKPESESALTALMARCHISCQQMHHCLI